MAKIITWEIEDAELSVAKVTLSLTTPTLETTLLIMIDQIINLFYYCQKWESEVI